MSYSIILQEEKEIQLYGITIVLKHIPFGYSQEYNIKLSELPEDKRAIFFPEMRSLVVEYIFNSLKKWDLTEDEKPVEISIDNLNKLVLQHPKFSEALLTHCLVFNTIDEVKKNGLKKSSGIMNFFKTLKFWKKKTI